MQACPVMYPLAPRIRGDHHLERVAGGDVLPGGTARHALDRTQHLPVKQDYQVGLEMVARGADLEGQVVGGVTVLRSDQAGNVYSGKVTPVTLHGIIHAE